MTNRAGEDTPRECPALGCGKPIADTSSACFRHWSALPLGLRKKIRRFIGRDLPQAEAEAMKKAQRVWTELGA